METYLIYILKVIALQSLLFGFYWAIARKSGGFQFNRFFLLSILIVPLFLPFIKIPFTFFNAPLNSEGAFDPWFLIEQSLPSVVISGGKVATQSLGWWAILVIVLYFAVVIPSFFKFIFDYYKIYKLGKLSVDREYTPHGFRLLYVPTKILSFSFLNRIFLSNLFPLKPQEKKTIVTHEEYHLTQRHSIDIIISELIRIVCWFNPVILLVQKSLKETHEYLADKHTVVKFGRNDYAQLLRSFKWQEMNMMLGSGYSSASIKNRLHMIEAKKQGLPLVKMMALSLLTLFTIFLFACENDLDSFENKDEGFQYEFSEADLTEEIKTQVQYLEKQDAPQNMIDLYVIKQQNHPEYLYMTYIFKYAHLPNENLNIEKIKKSFANNLMPSELIFFEKIEDDGKRGGIVMNDESLDNAYSEKTEFALIRRVDRLTYMEYNYKNNQNDATIHDDFDKAAQFKGGMNALVDFLRTNLKYPENAKRLGIEDKLTLRFVVSQRGGLVYLNIDKEPITQNEEVSIEFQKAAFAAIRETSGMWEPAEKNGKYVSSKMILPIEFSLKNK